jgi:hypothetical protein
MGSNFVGETEENRIAALLDSRWLQRTERNGIWVRRKKTRPALRAAAKLPVKVWSGYECDDEEQQSSSDFDLETSDSGRGHNFNLYHGRGLLLPRRRQRSQARISHSRQPVRVAGISWF